MCAYKDNLGFKKEKGSVQVKNGRLSKKKKKESLETNPYDCATNNDNHAKKGNKEPLETDPCDCATDNGKLLED